MKYMLLFYSLLITVSAFFFPSEPHTLPNEANKYMWEQFHQGHYDSIPQVLHKLEDAYILDPKNVRTTAHLGFIHLWVFCERGRAAGLDPKLIQHIYQSNNYRSEENT